MNIEDDLFKSFELLAFGSKSKGKRVEEFLFNIWLKCFYLGRY